jgi:predicted RNA-binding protein with EMAP domain
MSLWRVQRQKETYTDLSRSLNQALKAISLIRLDAIDRYDWERLQQQLADTQDIIDRLIAISHDPYYTDEELQPLYTGVKNTWVDSDTTIRPYLDQINTKLQRLQDSSQPSQELSDTEFDALKDRLEDIRDVANETVEENKQALRGNFA